MLEHTDPGEPRVITIGTYEFWEFPNGRLLPVIRGADGSDDADDDGDGSDDDKDGDGGGSGSDDDKNGADDSDDDKKLGEGGKKALEAERKARRDAERARKTAEDELAKLRKQGETDQEKKLREAEEAARTDERAKAKKIALKGAVRSAAAGKFANPDIAIKLLDLEELDVDDEGDLAEPKKLEKQIADLLKENPGLAAKGSGGKLQGNGDGGGRRESGSGSEGFGLTRLKGVDRSNSKKSA